MSVRSLTADRESTYFQLTSCVAFELLKLRMWAPFTIG